MLFCDYIIFWQKHFERPVYKDYSVEDFGFAPKRIRSRFKERWSRRHKRK